MKRFNIRKLNLSLILIAIVAMLGAFSYTIFAVLQTSLKFHNTISFVAVGMHYTIDGDVHYKNPETAGQTKISATSAHLNWSKDFSQNSSPNAVEWNLGDLNFSRESINTMTIVYDFTIQNYDEFAVKIYFTGYEVSVDNQSTIRNTATGTLSGESENYLEISSDNYITLPAATNSIPNGSAKIRLESRLLTSQFSFNYDNTFGIVIEKI